MLKVLVLPAVIVVLFGQIVDAVCGGKFVFKGKLRPGESAEIRVCSVQQDFASIVATQMAGWLC